MTCTSGEKLHSGGPGTMQKSRKILAIIPAKGGSKGVPRKNIRLLAGKPLIDYTIEAAKESKIFDKIVVSTEDLEIAQVARKYKEVNIIKRPKKLARDKTSTELVILHILRWFKKKENYQPDIIYLLQPTSPLRNGDDIKGTYKKFIREKLDSLLSVAGNKSFIWKMERNRFKPINYNYLRRPRRQNMKNQFKENGAIYITKYSTFMKFQNRLGGKIGYYMMNEDRSIEIDSLFDLLVAKQILKKRRKK